MCIDRIEPTHWFAGMKDSCLQLMVYGKGIRQAKVSVDYPGVRLTRVVRLDSQNYLWLYLDLATAQPGRIPLTFTLGKHRHTHLYTLREREKAGEERKGFTNADVLYMLLPDRFAHGGDVGAPIAGMRPYQIDRQQPNLRHGGNLEGIRQHLDYFRELGVTALWLTPVLENNSADSKGYSTYHGYATTDYYKVDARLGTNDSYRLLCDEAHSRGLKIVMDMIFNHCSFDHPWLRDMPSQDWFNGLPPTPTVTSAHKSAPSHVVSPLKNRDNILLTNYKLTTVVDPYASDIDFKETVEGWFVPSMPDLNQRNPHLLRYLIQNSIWWIETMGIDGIRMDTYPYADAHAMATWMKAIQREYPFFTTVGETWVTEPAYTAAWQRDSRLVQHNSYLPAVMDFAFFDRINHAKHEETDDWWKGLNRVYHTLVYDYLYPNPALVMAFLDNHDTDRFLGKGKDSTALRQALAILLTIKRTPQLYYGTEILMNGTKQMGDGDVRKDFPGGFPGDKRNAFTPEGRTAAEQALFEWLRTLLHWRQGNAVIIHGSQKQFIPQNGVYVIARQYEGNTVLTILNGKRKPATFHVARYAEVIGQQEVATDIHTGAQVDLTHDWVLQPRETRILSYSSPIFNTLSQ